VGFLLLDRLAEENEIAFSHRKWKSLYGRGKIGAEEVILAKPQTYMNLSGEAVRQLLQFFQISPENLIVVHDDLDLPFGKVRIRLRGGHGGHKGIQSILEALKNSGFIRLKIGIGRPEDPGKDPADYVLEPLTGEKKEELKDMIQRNVKALEVLLREGPEKAMNRFHKDSKERGAGSRED